MANDAEDMFSNEIQESEHAADKDLQVGMWAANYYPKLIKCFILRKCFI